MPNIFSISEEHGLAAIPKTAQTIYSVGVSTAGAAELRMAEGHPERHIIATTIDEAGAAAVRRAVHEASMAARIEVKLEDVGEPLPYPANHFDYIYARLVLHYLPKQTLAAACAELCRVLKPGGTLFAVVRSTNNADATRDTSVYDPATGFTTFDDVVGARLGKPERRQRMFHTPSSITGFLTAAGLAVQHIDIYREQLFSDFARSPEMQPPHTDELIEVLATK